MLKYKFKILNALKNAGYNTGRIRREKILSEGVLQKLREDKPVGASNLESLCKLLGCQPGDILEYVPDQETE